MTTKASYRVRNWSDYIKALINRGSINIWLDEKSIASWNETSSLGLKGRPKIYSDIAIESALIINAATPF